MISQRPQDANMNILVSLELKRTKGSTGVMPAVVRRDAHIPVYHPPRKATNIITDKLTAKWEVNFQRLTRPPHDCISLYLSVDGRRCHMSLSS